MNDYITRVGDVQVEIPVSEVLIDDRFQWRARKVKTLKLAALYDKAGMPDLAERARTCATWLQYFAQPDGTKQLQGANFCQLRLCPMCIGRRAKRAAYKLSQVLDYVEREHGAKFLFLTLTIRNVDGDHLGDALGQLTRAWKGLIDQRQIQRSVKGWFRAIEITRKGKGYHPHIHAILAVEPDYFRRGSGIYITHAEWLRRWQLALRVDYAPSVRIQTAKGKGEYTAGRAAAVEAAKYATKDDEYIDPKLPEKLAVEIVTDYTRALHRRRLTAYGGWLKEAAAALDAGDLETGDLIHTEEDTIRGDVAELIEDYRWSFGAGDYILADRRTNPLKVVRE